jgi:hypothetical protein
MRRTLLSLFLVVAACGENKTLPPDRDPATDPDPEPLTCVPNLDEQIDARELQPTFGVPAHYVVNPPGTTRDVDVVGTTGEDGLPVWDFAIDFADDQALAVAAGTLEGKWYGASFPDGAFVTPFNHEGTLQSIGLVRDDAFLLLGLASSEESPPEGQTLLVYDPPIVVLKLPVVEGDTFVSTGQITNGKIQGLSYAGRDTYEVTVDAMGSVDLPQLTFEQVHRVRTKVTVEPAVGATVVRRQVSFFAECFGEVARVTSQDGEADADFTTAAELRRLGQ